MKTKKGRINIMTLKEIKDLWFYYYGEDLKTQYSGFYKKLEKLEKTIDNEEKEIEKQRGKNEIS
tara:strand:- start:273 stop:464 length:192 start_codon:yes stop_codon:yes gene_type:complete